MTQITAILPFPGGAKAVAAALRPFGLTFPDPNRQSVNGAMRLVWTGREQAFLVGPAAPEMAPGLAATLDGAAAVTDQSDGWAVLTLSGPLARETLARLVPLDLRDTAFAVGAVARSGLNHMQMILTRSDTATYEVMVFRSMARTAWHELAEALQTQAARLDAMS
nr:sarcosine oxidase subunit gamma family protein [Gemmobacter straminiformis]